MTPEQKIIRELRHKLECRIEQVMLAMRDASDMETIDKCKGQFSAFRAIRADLDYITRDVLDEQPVDIRDLNISFGRPS